MCTPIGNILSYIFSSVTPREKVTVNGDHYTLLREIGRGGYSVVYLAQEVTTKLFFALKRVIVFDEAQKETALVEVEILNKFNNHPHILRMYKYDLKPSTKPGAEEVLILLEYYPKGTLQDFIDKIEEDESYLPEDVILHIFLGICAAVRELHRQVPPLAHRDIKPHNILMGDNHHPVLLDFGSVVDITNVDKNSKQFKHIYQEESDARSTPSYRAPELFDLKGILEDKIIDQRVDIWSLGCLLYAMAFHINPFDLELLRGANLRMAVHSGKFNFPSGSLYSEGFRQFISSLINIDPQERPFIDEVIHTTEKLWNNASEQYI